jgi:hypothetical protein
MYFPLQAISTKLSFRGYINENPETRITQSIVKERGKPQEEVFQLTIKSKGNLIRHEVNMGITMSKFMELSTMMHGEFAIKRTTEYKLSDKITLVDNTVDSPSGPSFRYVEVEFEDEASAIKFDLEDELKDIPGMPEINPGDIVDVTNDSTYKMGNYWYKYCARDYTHPLSDK